MTIVSEVVLRRESIPVSVSGDLVATIVDINYKRDGHKREVLKRGKRAIQLPCGLFCFGREICYWIAMKEF